MVGVSHDDETEITANGHAGLQFGRAAHRVAQSN